MHDINFFEEYQRRQKSKKLRALIRGVVISACLGLVLGVFLGNALLISSYSKSQAELESFLNDPDHMEEARRNKENEIELALLQAYEAWLTGLDRKIKGTYTNMSLLAGRFFSHAAGTLQIQQMDISGDTFTIRGYAANEEAAARYKANLDKNPDYSGIMIQHMELRDNRYYFTLKGKAGRREDIE